MLLEKLAKELNLNVRSEAQKNIDLITPLFPGKDLGNLLVTHLSFAEKYIDSRLCAKITNVNINIAKIMDTFGITDFANPNGSSCRL